MASPVAASSPPNYSQATKGGKPADKDIKAPRMVVTSVESSEKMTSKDENLPLLSYNFEKKRWEAVGATKAENAALKSKYDPLLYEKAKKDGIRVDVVDWQEVYREYTDGRFIKDMPKHYEAGDEIWQIRKVMDDTLYSYFDGKSTTEDIAKAFEEIVRKTKDLLYERHQTSGKNLADNKKIIQSTLLSFRITAISRAVAACYYEGERKYGCNEVRQGAYYNSDYHYLSKDAIETIEKTALALGEALPSDAVDLDEWKTYAPSMNDMYDTFNSRWSWANGMNSSRAEITNLSETPPKDVAFFYHDKGTESTVEFMINNNSQTVKAPFDDAKGISKFKLSDLIKLQSDGSAYQQSLSWFFDSVSIFSYMGYTRAHNTGLNARA